MAGLIAFLVWTGATVSALLTRTDGLVDRRRPRRVSVVPLAFALAVTGALMNAGFNGALGEHRAPRPPPGSSVADPPPASAPVFSGPPSGAPLPKLNLPITFDYGPGPRYPTPGPGPPSLAQATPAVGRLPLSGTPPGTIVRAGPVHDGSALTSGCPTSSLLRGTR
jgi:hypothetical protein